MVHQKCLLFMIKSKWTYSLMLQLFYEKRDARKIFVFNIAHTLESKLILLLLKKNLNNNTESVIVIDIIFTRRLQIFVTNVCLEICIGVFPHGSTLYRSSNIWELTLHHSSSMRFCCSNTDICYMAITLATHCLRELI
jgi:hypothetical protein